VLASSYGPISKPTVRASTRRNATSTGRPASWLATGAGDHQLAAPADRQPARAGEAQPDRARITSRRDHEVHLEVPCALVVEGVDRRVDLAIAHAGEMRDVPSPAARIGAHEIVAARRQRILAARACGGISALEHHAQRGGSPPLRGLEHQGGRIRLEEQRVAPLTSEKVDALVDLAAIGLEGHRQRHASGCDHRGGRRSAGQQGSQQGSR
jgi:hypothetical protein